MTNIKQQRDGWVVNRDGKAIDPLFSDSLCKDAKGVYTFLKEIGLLNLDGFFVWGDFALKGVPASRWLATYEEYINLNREPI